jgi:hypothetical protein
MHNTEDKAYWWKSGEDYESIFIKEIAPIINRNLVINPEKKQYKASIDLLNIDSGIFADLKTQETPFFTAYRYGLNPQTTVTFNKKDYEYYAKQYPTADIYWWVNWKQTAYKSYTVDPLYGVWESHFIQIKTTIERGRAPLHSYINRKGDLSNATESYLFDLNDFIRLM